MSSQSSTARIAALAAAVTGVLFASQALASGFQIRENSTKNAGRAFSGSAVARDDASVVLNNPAAMVNLKGNTVRALLLNASGILIENGLLAREHLVEILKGAHSTIASVIV